MEQEQRLIDARAFQTILSDMIYKNGINDVVSLRTILNLVDEAPTVDAVPVVRCVECSFLNTKYFEAGEGNYYCHRTGDRTELTDFCSRGEPRTPPAE